MYLLELFNNPLQAILFLLAVVIAISIHEYAHAVTSYHFGDDTPKLMGRITLNPLAHIDPLGGLFFILVGFGWGKPVIINPMRYTKAIHELWVSLAGPFSNLILALAINLILRFVGGALPASLVDSLTILANINVILAAFNIIPIPPLDGSSILAYFIPGYKSFAAGQFGFLILIMLLFFPGPSGNSLLSTIFQPIFSFFSLITLSGGI